MVRANFTKCKYSCCKYMHILNQVDRSIHYQDQNDPRLLNFHLAFAFVFFFQNVLIISTMGLQHVYFHSAAFAFYDNFFAFHLCCMISNITPNCVVQA
jgi:hypothetical protein